MLTNPAHLKTVAELFLPSVYKFHQRLFIDILKMSKPYRLRFVLKFVKSWVSTCLLSGKRLGKVQARV